MLIKFFKMSCRNAKWVITLHVTQETMKSSERKTGTVVRGIRCPIIRNGDLLADTVFDSLMGAAREE